MQLFCLQLEASSLSFFVYGCYRELPKAYNLSCFAHNCSYLLTIGAFRLQSENLDGLKAKEEKKINCKQKSSN